MISTEFTSPLWLKLFKQHDLEQFSSLWNLKLKPVDPPNLGRGGRSEVCVLEIGNNRGELRRFYIKRQENYNCVSLWHPLKGISLAEREFNNIAKFNKANIATVNPIYFNKRVLDGKYQAILITESLEHHIPLDQWFEKHSDASSHQKLLTALGHSVASLHSAGLTHNYLYAKHVFVRDNLNASQPIELVYIDLEGAHSNYGLFKLKFRDLKTLYRRAGLSHEDYRYFLAAYMGLDSGEGRVEKMLQRLKAIAKKKASK